MTGKHYVIVGAGLAGAVLARELVSQLSCEIEILELKEHIGGHCYTERDPTTKILLHKYGPHIFNTNREDVWRYVNRFGRFRRSSIESKRKSTRKFFLSLSILSRLISSSERTLILPKLASSSPQLPTSK